MPGCLLACLFVRPFYYGLKPYRDLTAFSHGSTVMDNAKFRKTLISSTFFTFILFV